MPSFHSFIGTQHSHGQCTAAYGENIVGSRVFQDTNSNGVFERETGVNGTTVYLFEDFDDDGVTDGPAIQTTATDVDGDYTFTVNLIYSLTLSYSGSITQSSDHSASRSR